jgi:outer membrane immunogenic protein
VGFGALIMHRVRCGTLAGLAALGFASLACAAELPVKAPMRPAPAADPAPWRGWYAGLNAGGSWGSSQAATTVGNGTAGVFLLPVAVAAINAIGAPRSMDTSGFTGGVHGGYNYRAGRWLWGIEADFQYFRNRGSQSVTGLVTAGVPGTITSSVSTDWLFTLRPRIGMVWNDWLVFGTGGLALTEMRADWNFLVTTGALTTESATRSAITPGWIVGAGVETALPGQYTFGVEYLFASFGRVSTDHSAIFIAGIGFATNPVHHSADLQANIVRSRLSKPF